MDETNLLSLIKLWLDTNYQITIKSATITFCKIFQELNKSCILYIFTNSGDMFSRHYVEWQCYLYSIGSGARRLNCHPYHMTMGTIPHFGRRQPTTSHTAGPRRALVKGVFSWWTEKFRGVLSNVSRDVGRGVWIIIKKTNYITRLETVRRIY
jgi:hypothetical protein